MRITLAAAVACLTLGGLAAAGDVTAAIRKPTDIPAEGLGPALTTLAKEFDFQVLYRTEIVSELKSPGAVGALTCDEALRKVLIGTGLTYKYLDDKTVTIVPASMTAPAQATERNADPSDASSSKEVGKKSSRDFRLAQVDQGKGPKSSSVAQEVSGSQENSKGQTIGLQEIIVTASKRAENIQDVPSSITVLSGKQLELTEPQSLIDLNGYVPGLTITSGGAPGQTHLTLRGVSVSNVGTTLVGTYIDELPISSSSAAVNGDIYTPDLMPYDIERIEVLEGPQGTLYGASTMGGLLKYVLKQPGLENFDGQVGLVANYIDRSGDVGGGVRAAADIPLIGDVLGIRVSGFDQKTQGYINNVGLGVNDYNSYIQQGGRLAALWKVNDQLSVKFSAMFDDTFAQGLSGVTVDPNTSRPSFGNYNIYTYVPMPSTTRLQLYSLVADWDLGFATLTSASGWETSYTNVTRDLTPIWRSLVAASTGVEGAFVPYPNPEDLHKFTQEVRLVSAAGNRFEWMVGAFYTHESATNVQSVYATDSAGQLLPGINPFFDNVATPIIYDELAGFANGTLHFTDQLALSAGIRYSGDSQHFINNNGYGAIYGSPGDTNPPSPSTFISLRNSKDVITWMGGPEWHLSKDSMIYAKVATGYRAGSATGLTAPDPVYANPDTLTSYELGSKNSLLGGALTVDVAIYDIQWKDIQVLVTQPVTDINYLGNGKTARTRGGEASLSYATTDNLRIGATLGYVDAQLTQTAIGLGGPGADGLDGARLPLVSKLNGALTADYRRAMTTDTSFRAGASFRYSSSVWSYVSSLPSATESTQPKPVDLYAGVQYHRADIRLFMRNIFNSEPKLLRVTDPSNWALNQLDIVPIPPRTIGLSIDFKL
jgi:iron complex outermembrane recepter protein